MWVERSDGQLHSVASLPRLKCSSTHWVDPRAGLNIAGGEEKNPKSFWDTSLVRGSFSGHLTSPW